jgi:bacterioferritin-associated ferredoxin
MYVCICNALKEAEARRVAPSCDAAHQIYGQLGCTPQCGRCIPTMKSILDEMRATAAATVPVSVPRVAAE